MAAPQPEHRPGVQPPHLVQDEPDLPPLRVGVRILLFALGSFLVLFGLIFGPLPLIPAVVLVPAGVALLSTRQQPPEPAPQSLHHAPLAQRLASDPARPRLVAQPPELSPR